jgi:hypothetical protein
VSQFAVEVVRVGQFTKNPNSDTLMMTDVLGHPVQFKEGAFQQGDLAAYIPVESMVPLAHPEFEFLKSPNHPERTHERIKAKRLRGVFSMGFLIPAPAGAAEGQDLAKDLGVYKYEEPEEKVVFEASPPTGWKRFFLKWRWKLLSWLGFKRTAGAEADLPGLRHRVGAQVPGPVQPRARRSSSPRRSTAATPGSAGTSASSTSARAPSTGTRATPSYWSEIARELDLKEKLKPYPGIALYGEVFGSGVQDLEYGAPGRQALPARLRRARHRDAEVVGLRPREGVRRGHLGLKMAPELYRGPWQGLEAHAPLGEGKTTLGWTATQLEASAASARAGS